MDLTSALEKLFEMKQEGRLSEDEFQKEKTRLLAQQREELKEPQSTSVKAIYKDYWRKSFVWRGRASRSEYWWPVAVNAGISVGFAVFLFLSIFVSSPFILMFFALLQLVGSFFNFANIFPYCAVFVRRFHDLDKSAWFAFAPAFLVLFLMLIVGVCMLLGYDIELEGLYLGCGIGFVATSIVWFIYTCLPGTLGDNRYGKPRV